MLHTSRSCSLNLLRDCSARRQRPSGAGRERDGGTHGAPPPQTVQHCVTPAHRGAQTTCAKGPSDHANDTRYLGSQQFGGPVLNHHLSEFSAMPEPPSTGLLHFGGGLQAPTRGRRPPAGRGTGRVGRTPARRRDQGRGREGGTDAEPGAPSSALPARNATPPRPHGEVDTETQGPYDPYHTTTSFTISRKKTSLHSPQHFC